MLAAKKKSEYLNDLLNAIKTIEKLPKKTLLNTESLTAFLYSAGPNLANTASTKERKEAGTGFKQHPRELACALIVLAKLNVQTFVEVGTLWGWTASLTAAYLLKFSKSARVTAVDADKNVFEFYSVIKNILPIELLVPATSETIKGRVFDACFIDGNHRGQWPKNDYDNVGKFSKVCMFHDIKNVNCKNLCDFWAALKKDENLICEEFACCSNMAGIGVAIKKYKTN